MSRLHAMFVKKIRQLNRWLAYKRDYYRRWKRQMPHSSWDEYLKQVFRQSLQNRRRERNHLEWAVIQTKLEPVSVVCWLAIPENKNSPYVCGACNHIDLAGKARKLSLQTIKYRLPNETLSRQSWLAEVCLACNSILINRPSKQVRAPSNDRAQGQNYNPVYALSWTVSYGQHYNKKRRVQLSQTDLSLVWQGAEPMRIGEALKEPSLREREITKMKVGGVEIKLEHPQFEMFMDCILSLEEGWMSRRRG